MIKLPTRFRPAVARLARRVRTADGGAPVHRSIQVPAVRMASPAARRSLVARLVAGLGSVSLLVTLSGCATVTGDVRPFKPIGATPVDVHTAIADAAAARPAAGLPADGGGSIYAAGGGRAMRLFQDNKAREVGDLLTVVLVERTSSKSTAKTAVTKEAGVSIGAPTIAGMPVTYNGQNLLEAEIEGGRDFNGSGDSQQSNKLDGNITVTVVRDLGNGNLLVSGEKRIRLNQGDELVQVQGIVRTADIGPDNRVPSDRIGDARIVYGGRGTLARSNAMGWLGRFFNSAAFPY